jgi:bifunctional ADP-heptose synthase (sugar kinase/adenylyltransferase)
VFIKDAVNKYFIPAHIRNIADVSGAGDTVISVATLCLAAGLSIKEIAEIANLAGGLVCEKSGVVSIDKELLIEEVMVAVRS